jgi:hypothetical protein
MSKKLELRLEPSIQSWITSRDWLTHYAGRGDWTFAHFVQMPLDEIEAAEKCPDTDLPLRSDTFDVLYLGKEYAATYSFPRCHVKIAKSQIDDVTYDLRVHFAHLRAGYNYECVFCGYIQSLVELVGVFSLLGVEKRYLI